MNEYIKQGHKEEELKNQIQIDFDFLFYIWFRKDVELISILEAERFQEGGILSDLSDIEPIF